MGAENKDTDMLGMSDEDFLNLSGPPETEPVGSTEGAQPEAVQEGEQEQEQQQEPAATDAAQEEQSQESGEEEQEEELDGKVEAEKDSAPAAKDPAKDKPAEPAAPNKDKPAVVETDYKSFHDQVMAPFKANGKMIQLKSPEEAIALMQMGANYTRKMQEIQPHRKVLLMLENNGLLDEGKLSYLIDLDKKNPDAIKKLVKDAGLDPMDIDTSEESAYRVGNHRVSDEEAAFRGVLDELSTTDNGKQTLQVINSTWDQASKELLWKNPGVMNLINQQRELGIYDRILTEVERRKALGQVPINQPLLQIYQQVGQEMVAGNAFADIVQPAQQPRETVAPVASRVVPPKPVVKNGDRATAAAPSKAAAKPAKVIVNPLSMSDEDFLKQFQGRL